MNRKAPRTHGGRGYNASRYVAGGLRADVEKLPEDKRRFEIPEGFRVPRSKGVGKAAVGQGELLL